jgi:hypothetical protein
MLPSLGVFGTIESFNTNIIIHSKDQPTLDR